LGDNVGGSAEISEDFSDGDVFEVEVGFPEFRKVNRSGKIDVLENELGT
jgi:hypothetical protein